MKNKNLILLSFIMLMIGSAFAGEKGMDQEFKPLFNGENFDGWYLKLKNDDAEMAKKVFVIEDSMIHVFDDSWPNEIDLDEGTDGTIGMMYTKAVYEKYHLKFEYKWGSKKANYFKKWQYDAGVYYHITDDKIFPTGVEFQVHYHHKKDKNGTGDLIRPGGQKYDWYYNPETFDYLHPDEGGILYEGQEDYEGRTWLHRAKSTTNFNALNDQWNTCEIIVMGSEYTIHKLNGDIVNVAFNLNLGAGIIGFQSETAEIFYKNIEIKVFEESIPLDAFLKK